MNPTSPPLPNLSFLQSAPNEAAVTFQHIPHCFKTHPKNSPRACPKRPKPPHFTALQPSPQTHPVVPQRNATNAASFERAESVDTNRHTASIRHISPACSHLQSSVYGPQCSSAHNAPTSKPSRPLSEPRGREERTKPRAAVRHQMRQKPPNPAFLQNEMFFTQSPLQNPNFVPQRLWLFSGVCFSNRERASNITLGTSLEPRVQSSLH